MTDSNDTERPISLYEQGFRMPPEWYPHQATWMAWPHNISTWPENLEAAQSEYIELVAAIAEDEPVMLMCHGDSQIDQFLNAVGRRPQKLTNVHIVDIPTNDAWTRDYAPTFVTNRETQEQIGIDWRYNAWGGKYPPYDLDQLVPKHICQHIVKSKPQLGPGCAHQKMEFCIEGGAIEINEQGTVLCTRSCALDPKRNRRVTESRVERLFQDTLGASQIVWLSADAIAGDDTDGHIDQLARFTPSGSILYAYGTDSSDPQYDLLDANLQELKQGVAAIGTDVELVPLHLPEPIQLFGQRLPASYCNFYITNAKVIVPQFGQPSDERAIGTIQEHFPKRQVIGLPSTQLAFGQGSFHCLTQQQPVVDGI